MTPAARVASAIEVLDRILAGAPAEQALTGWARASRFAGSGDRAALRDHVFDALRCLRSYTAMAGAAQPSGRSLMIGALRAAGRDPAEMFSGANHAPAVLSDEESRGLATAPAWAELALADRIDCPDWLIAPLQNALGADMVAVTEAQRRRAPVFVRVNLMRTNREAARLALADDGIESQPHALADTALEVTANPSKIKMSRAYLDGLVELQDAASQAAVSLLNICDGARVLDYCAGGGGKALAIAGRAKCELTAHDVAPERMRDLPSRAARAGAEITLADKASLLGRNFDHVIVDAPCSGSGTWRRTPDAKWRLTPARLVELIALQDAILAEAARFVAPGGRLAFMTCSLLQSENRDRLDVFLARHEGFALSFSRHFTPLEGCDGFFVAGLTRR